MIEARQPRGVRVRCPIGGYAPCVDDLCHSGDTTLCGLEWHYDFCEHYFIPDSCPDCADDSLDDSEDMPE